MILSYTCKWVKYLSIYICTVGYIGDIHIRNIIDWYSLRCHQTWLPQNPPCISNCPVIFLGFFIQYSTLTIFQSNQWKKTTYIYIYIFMYIYIFIYIYILCVCMCVCVYVIYRPWKIKHPTFPLTAGFCLEAAEERGQKEGRAKGTSHLAIRFAYGSNDLLLIATQKTSNRRMSLIAIVELLYKHVFS